MGFVWVCEHIPIPNGRVWLGLWNSELIFHCLKSWQQNSKIQIIDKLKNGFLSLYFTITIKSYMVNGRV